MLDKINEGMEYYEIVLSGKSIGEDGRYIHGKGASVVGYAVVNKENGITEFTTTVLPTAIFQADYMEKALKSLLSDEPETAEGSEVSTDDVFPPVIN